MIKRVFLGGSLLILVTFLLLRSVDNTWKQSEVCFEGHCFEVELAATAKEKEMGLMFRESLNSNKGMLFIYEQPGIYPFWMKNTLVPLDIIWISEDFKVVFINENTQPCLEKECVLVEPSRQAKYVLEVKGGTSTRIGLRVGKEVSVNIWQD